MTSVKETLLAAASLLSAAPESSKATLAANTKRMAVPLRDVGRPGAKPAALDRVMSEFQDDTSDVDAIPVLVNDGHVFDGLAWIPLSSVTSRQVDTMYSRAEKKRVLDYEEDERGRRDPMVTYDSGTFMPSGRGVGPLGDAS